MFNGKIAKLLKLIVKEERETMNLEKEIKEILGNDAKISQDGFNKNEYQIEWLVATEPTVLTFDVKEKTINTDKKLFKTLNLKQKAKLTKVVLSYIFEEK